jgi:hypothetical protein
MTGKEALKEIQTLISDAKENGKAPTKVLIPSEYENALMSLDSSDIGSDLKSKITIDGVQAAFPKINGVKTEWNANKLDLKY